jgi:hypothetical protein
MEDVVGLRGPHAVVRSNHQRLTDEPAVSDTAVRIYRRLRRLELECTCTDEMKTDVSAEWCPACAECWRLNGKLCGLFGLPAWQFAYWDPRWETHRPMQSAIDRFHLLERKAAKKPKFKYKWER